MTGDASIRAGSADRGAAAATCWHHTGITPATIRTNKRIGSVAPVIQTAGAGTAQPAHRRAPSGPRLPLGQRLAALAAVDPALASSLTAYIKQLRTEAAQHRVESRRLRAHLASLEERRS